MADKDPSQPGSAAARRDPNGAAFGALRAERPRTARYGDHRHRPGIAPPHPAVRARRPARSLRVLPGVPAARPLHHRGAAGDAGHPGPRIRWRQHRILRTGQRITLGAGAFHGQAARRHPAAGRRRLAGQRDPHPGAAHRGGPHLGRPAARCGADAAPSTRPAPSTTPTAFPEAYKQAVAPLDAIADIAIIEELREDSVKLVFADGAERRSRPSLTWYLGGRSASLSELLPMLQCMGVVVLEERPFTVTRADGLQVWIYQFKISPHPTIRAGCARGDRATSRSGSPTRSPRSGRARSRSTGSTNWSLRAGLTWQQVVILRAYAKYLRQAGFPYSQSHIESVINGNADTARSLVELFEAFFDPEWPPARPRPTARSARTPPRRRSPPTSMPWSAWTPTGCCARSPPWCRPPCGPTTLSVATGFGTGTRRACR